MPRGREIIGPPKALAPPRRRDDPDALIDAALQGWALDAHVRALWPNPSVRGSWTDATNHPKNPRDNHRPRDHYRPLVVKAVALLMRERRWKQYRARRYVADRLLSLLPSDLTMHVLGIPRSTFSPSKCKCGSRRIRATDRPTGPPDAYQCDKCSTFIAPLTDDARHAAARKVIMERLKQACPA